MTCDRWNRILGVVFREDIGAQNRRRVSGERAMAADRKMKLVFPALAGLYENCAPYSYAIIRFATGAILVPHGVQKILNTPIAKFAPNIAAKGLPFSEALAYLTYFAESAAA